MPGKKKRSLRNCVHGRYSHGASERAFLITLALVSVGLVFVIALSFSPVKAKEYLSVSKLNAKGKVTKDWKHTFEIVKWERDYIAGYLMPLVGFGVALLTYLHERQKNSKAQPSKRPLRIAIVLLLSCAMLMTVGLGLRNAWVTTGDGLPPWQIFVDRKVLAPLTAVLFIDTFILFVYSMWRGGEAEKPNAYFLFPVASTRRNAAALRVAFRRHQR